MVTTWQKSMLPAESDADDDSYMEWLTVTDKVIKTVMCGLSCIMCIA